MNPQLLHDVWLAVTVMTTLTIGGIALFLLVMFRQSPKRKFFWVLAVIFISVSVEQACSEIKNLYPGVLEAEMLWLAGRIQEAIVSGCGLLYMVFGRNGKEPAQRTEP